jgi:adenosine deaminase
MDFGHIARERLPELLCAMPKAELHIHIEGSLEPELIFELARKNGVALAYPDVESLRAAYAFTDLQSFLDIYYAGASVLLHESDFEAMAMAYLRRAAADNVVRAELFFDPQTHTARGVAIGTVIEGICDGITIGRERTGISVYLLPNFVRHLSADDAMKTLEESIPYRDRLLGWGLDSSEVGNPPEKFADVFRVVRDDGFHVVMHAGEEGPAEYIVQALELGAERIDHGVRAVEDPKLVRRLAEEQIPLTVCPQSNVKLRVFDRIEDHTLPQLLANGVLVTINSDDPAYFDGYIADNFAAVRAAGIRDDQLIQIAKNSFTASFLPPEEKQRHIAAIEALAGRLGL